VTDLKETLERLYGRIAKGTKLGLERIQAAADRLGNPEKSFEAVHVAGTNGKGSVCAFVAAMLSQKPEERVGLYTSPHLCRFAERIRIAGEPISDEQVQKHISAALDIDPELTFFEVTTLAAFLAFREAGVTIAVVEVGLGGRLDATNILPPPKVVAITRVAYDHTDILGDSLARIGAEKAGIVKTGSKVVLGKLHPDARGAAEKRIAEVGAELIPLSSAEPYPGAQLAYPRMAMFGTNLAVAMTVARQLDLTPEQMSRGVEATAWPGRNELLHRNGQELTLLDCCHNPDGAVLLSHIIDATAAETVGNRRQVALVFGAVEGKNWQAMLDRLEHTAMHRIYVKPDVPRGVPIEPMAERYSGELAPSIADALKRARSKVGPRGLVVVTGSTFIVGPARAVLLGLPTDPPVHY
jgi:dihydrofolate synthase / folylpolyglutamate synthase